MRIYINILLICCILSFASCGYISFFEEAMPDPASSVNTCDSNDIDCYLNSITLMSADGSEIRLYSVTQDLPSPSEEATLPVITDAPESLEIQETGKPYTLFLSWTNTFNTFPAFCLTLCLPDDENCSLNNFRCAQSTS